MKLMSGKEKLIIFGVKVHPTMRKSRSLRRERLRRQWIWILQEVHFPTSDHRSSTKSWRRFDTVNSCLNHCCRAVKSQFLFRPLLFANSRTLCAWRWRTPINVSRHSCTLWRERVLHRELELCWGRQKIVKDLLSKEAFVFSKIWKFF